MIYGRVNSAKRMRQIEILANANRRRILDFAMPWDSGRSLGSRSIVDAVLGPFAVENAAIRFQVANQVLALYSALTVNPSARPVWRGQQH
jgi:hypothetical protein